MARVYSRRALAQLICDGHNTSSASNLFSRSVEFVQKEQASPEYLYYFNQCRKRIETRERKQDLGAGITRAVTVPFEFSSEDDFTVFEGSNAMVDTVYWRQGNPLIPNFALNKIQVWFYRDATINDRILMLDSDFVVSGEPLDEIVTLENFVDNDNGTGSFDVRVNPSEIDVMDLMRDRDFYIEYIVDQPD